MWHVCKMERDQFAVASDAGEWLGLYNARRAASQVCNKARDGDEYLLSCATPMTAKMAAYVLDGRIDDL